jgi:hypothetical protein
MALAVVSGEQSLSALHRIAKSGSWPCLLSFTLFSARHPFTPPNRQKQIDLSNVVKTTDTITIVVAFILIRDHIEHQVT